MSTNLACRRGGGSTENDQAPDEPSGQLRSAPPRNSEPKLTGRPSVMKHDTDPSFPRRYTPGGLSAWTPVLRKPAQLAVYKASVERAGSRSDCEIVVVPDPVNAFSGGEVLSGCSEW